MHLLLNAKVLEFGNVGNAALPSQAELILLQLNSVLLQNEQQENLLKKTEKGRLAKNARAQETKSLHAFFLV